MEMVEVVLGALLGLSVAVLVLRGLAGRGKRKGTGITEKELHDWFRHHRP